jgi:hypothetical protein
MHPRLVFLLLGLAVSTLPALAQGGAPMLTDDTGTPGAKEWELTLACTDQRDHHGLEQAQFPQAELDYGLTDRVQVELTMARLVEKEPGQERQSALGDSDFGVKWRFYDNPASGFSISVAPQLEFHNRSSTLEHGQLEGGTTWVLPLEIQGKLGPLEWGAELGRNLGSQDSDTWFYGLVLGRQVNPRLELAWELYATTQGSLANEAVTANVGARWKLTEHQTLLIAAGRGVNRAEGNELTFTGFLGLQLDF